MTYSDYFFSRTVRFCASERNGKIDLRSFQLSYRLILYTIGSALIRTLTQYLLFFLYVENSTRYAISTLGTFFCSPRKKMELGNPLISDNFCGGREKLVWLNILTYINFILKKKSKKNIHNFFIYLRIGRRPYSGTAVGPF